MIIKFLVVKTKACLTNFYHVKEIYFTVLHYQPKMSVKPILCMDKMKEISAEIIVISFILFTCSFKQFKMPNFIFYFEKTLHKCNILFMFLPLDSILDMLQAHVNIKDTQGRLQTANKTN